MDTTKLTQLLWRTKSESICLEKEALKTLDESVSVVTIASRLESRQHWLLPYLLSLNNVNIQSQPPPPTQSELHITSKVLSKKLVFIDATFEENISSYKVLFPSTIISKVVVLNLFGKFQRESSLEDIYLFVESTRASQFSTEIKHKLGHLVIPFWEFPDSEFQKKTHIYEQLFGMEEETTQSAKDRNHRRKLILNSFSSVSIFFLPSTFENQRNIQELSDFSLIRKEFTTYAIQLLELISSLASSNFGITNGKYYPSMLRIFFENSFLKTHEEDTVKSFTAFLYEYVLSESLSIFENQVNADSKEIKAKEIKGSLEVSRIFNIQVEKCMKEFIERVEHFPRILISNFCKVIRSKTEELLQDLLKSSTSQPLPTFSPESSSKLRTISNSRNKIKELQELNADESELFACTIFQDISQLEKKIDLWTHYQSPTGYTVLHVAVLTQDIKLIKYVLSKAPHLVYYTTALLETPLHLVARHSLSVDIMKCLVDCGASVNCVDEIEFTPLHYSCHLGNLEATKYLVSRNANINASSKMKETALSLAISRNHFHVAIFLVESDASIVHVDEYQLLYLRSALIAFGDQTYSQKVIDLSTKLAMHGRDTTLMYLLYRVHKMNKHNMEANDLMFEISNTKSRNLSKVVKDRMILGNFCTFNKRELYSQFVFQCYTCKLTHDKGICINCIEHCHKGHDVSLIPYYYESFFCDCSDSICKIKVKSTKTVTRPSTVVNLTIQTESGSFSMTEETYSTIQTLKEKIRKKWDIHPFQEILLFKDGMEVFAHQALYGIKDSPTLYMRVIDRDHTVQIMKAYLLHLIQQYSSITLSGIRNLSKIELPLEKIYVALRCDSSTTVERMENKRLLESELQEQYPEIDFSELTPEERKEFIDRYLTENPYSKSVEERDLPALFHLQSDEKLTLGEAFQRERSLVILGDPGAGKTTLGKWLCLKLAKAKLQQLEGLSNRLVVPAEQVFLEASSGTVDLGPARLPIFIRAAEFTKARKENGKELSIEEFLSIHTWSKDIKYYNGHVINPLDIFKLLHGEIRESNSVLIVDGLDETEDRQSVVQAIDQYVKDNVTSNAPPPSISGLNQVIVTSRIAGYHSNYLSKFTHVTIEHMDKVAIDHFSESWFQAVLSMTLDSGTALAQAKKFQQTIYNHKHPGIYEIATNPLIVTVLITLFYNNHGSIPEKRVLLYQESVDFLITTWSQKNMQMNSTDIKQVLIPVAAYMHDNCQTGLISRSHLSHELEKELSKRGKGDPNWFINILVDKVGLLVERGDGLFGFLHLTFEEFLAGMHLLSGGPMKAREQILAKLPNPRWHESIVLALGYASSGSEWSSHDFELLVDELLKADENPLSELLPRSCLLMATVLPEMDKPSTSVVVKVAQHLIRAYRSTYLFQFQPLRSTIEQSFSALLETEYADITKRVIIDSLASSDSSLITHTARLVREIQLLDSKVMQAVVEALHKDSEEFGWEVNKTLRSVVAPQGFTLGSIDVPYPSNEEVKSIEAQIQSTEDENRVKILKTKLDDAKKKLKEEEQKYEKRGVTLIEHLNFIQKQPPKTSLSFPEILPFRNAVMEDKNLQSKILRDSRILQLVVALYGGYFDLNTPEFSEEYFRFSCFMQLDLNDRTPFHIILAKNWGGDKDQVTNKIKAHMTLSPKYTFHKISPKFQFECIYKDSSLTPIIKSCENLSAELKKLWESENSELAVDSIIGSLALSRDVDEIVQFINHQEKLGEKVLHKLSSVWDSIRDPVVRATNSLEPGLGFLSNKLSERKFRDLTRSVLDVTLECLCFPLDLSTVKNIIKATDSSFIKGEIIAHLLNGAGDEAARKARQQIPGLFEDFNQSLQMMKYASIATFRKWNRGLFTWTTRELVEPNSPGFIELYLGLKRMNPRLNDLFQSIIEKLKKLCTSDELHLFIDAVNLGSVSSQKSNSGWMTLSHRCRKIYESSKSLQNPYIACLIHAICSKINYNLKREVFENGWELSKKIQNHLERAQAREFLVMCAQPLNMEIYVVEWKKDIDMIESYADRAIALVRVALWFPSNQEHMKILGESLQAINLIKDQDQKVDVMQQLHKFFLLSPELQKSAETIATTIEDPVERSKALGSISPHLTEAVDIFTEEKEIHLWSPLSLAAKILDCQRKLNRFMNPISVEVFWRVMNINPKHPKITQYLQELSNKNQSIQLTNIAAFSVRKLFENSANTSILEKLIPLLRYANEDTIPQLFHYLRAKCNSHLQKQMQDFSALLLSEADDMTEETAELMSILAASPVDIVRFRVRKMFINGIWNSWNYHHLLRNTSTLGGKILRIIRRHCVRYYDEDKPGIGIALAWYFQNVFLDSPELIRDLVSDCASPDKSVVENAKALIRAFESLAENCEQEFITGVCHSNDAVACSFFKAVTVIAERNNVRKEFYPNLRAAIFSLPRFPEEVKKVIFNPNVSVAYAALIDAQGLISIPEKEPRKRLMRILGSGVLRDTLEFLQSTTGSNGKFTFSRALHTLGSLHLVSHSQLDLEAEQISYLVQNNPKLMDILIGYLEDTLKHDNSKKEEPTSFLTIAMNLLIATAAAAQCMPSKFVNLVKQHKDLKGLLRNAAQKHSTFPGRQSAIFLLSVIGKWDKDVSQVLTSCLHDVYYVTQTALDLPLHVKVIENSAIEELKPKDQLQGDSALLSYTVIQLLTMYSLKPSTPPERRIQIMQLFASAIRDERSLRTIQLAYSHSDMASLPIIRESLYQALVDISGFTIRRPSLVRKITTKINKENSKKTNVAYAEIVYQQLQVTDITDMLSYDAFLQRYNIVATSYGTKTMQWSKLNLFGLKALLKFLSISNKTEIDPKVWNKALEIGKKLIESPHYFAMLITEKMFIEILTLSQPLLPTLDATSEIAILLKGISTDVFDKVLIPASPWLRRIETSYTVLEDYQVDAILKGCIQSLEIAKTFAPTGLKIDDYILLSYRIMNLPAPFNFSITQQYQDLLTFKDKLQDKLSSESLKMFEELSEVIPCIHSSINSAATNQTEEAIDILSQGIKKYGKNVALRSQIAALLQKIGKLNEAIENLSVVVELSPKYYPAWKFRGDCYFKLYDYDKAARDYTRLLEFDHHDFQVVSKRGKCNIELFRIDEALIDLLWLLMMGDSEKALSDFKVVTDYTETFSSKDSPNHHLYLFVEGAKKMKGWSSSDFAVEKSDEAFDLFQECIKLSPKFGPAWVGFFYAQTGYKKLLSNEEKMGSRFSAFYIDLIKKVTTALPLFATPYGLQTDHVGIMNDVKLVDEVIEAFTNILNGNSSEKAEYVEYMERKQVFQLARSYKFKAVHVLGKSAIEECQKSAKKSIELLLGVEIPLNYTDKDIRVLDDFNLFSKALASVFSSLHIIFTLGDDYISYSDVFSLTGLLPPILKRAQELNNLLARSNLGVSMIEDSSALVGSRARLASTVRGIERFFPVIFCVMDCVTRANTKLNGLSLVVALDEFKTD